jgi:hypothetical protein
VVRASWALAALAALAAVAPAAAARTTDCGAVGYTDPGGGSHVDRVYVQFGPMKCRMAMGIDHFVESTGDLPSGWNCDWRAAGVACYTAGPAAMRGVTVAGPQPKFPIYCGVGTYNFEDVPFYQQVYVVRGSLSCKEAMQVTTASSESTSDPPGWSCTLGADGQYDEYQNQCTVGADTVGSIDLPGPMPLPSPTEVRDCGETTDIDNAIDVVYLYSGSISCSRALDFISNDDPGDARGWNCSIYGGNDQNSICWSSTTLIVGLPITMRYCQRPHGPGAYISASDNVRCATAFSVEKGILGRSCWRTERCGSRGFACRSYWNGSFDHPFSYSHHGICVAPRGRRIEFDLG